MDNAVTNLYYLMDSNTKVILNEISNYKPIICLRVTIFISHWFEQLRMFFYSWGIRFPNFKQISFLRLKAIKI